MSLLDAIARTDITAIEEANLVHLIRQTETAQVLNEDGETVTRYFPTSEQETALNTLIAAYIQDIRRAAKARAASLSLEDAEAIAVEKFISLTRDSSRSNERLAGFISKAMVNAVKDANAEVAAMRIPPRMVRYFFSLVEEFGSLDAAIAHCKTEANGIDPFTMLAISRSLNAESIEALALAMDNGEADYALVLDSTPGPEETVVQADLIRYLFTLVPEVQAQILRLAYGFTDTRTEALRVFHGYKYDETLSDEQISPVVSMGRATVNRARNKALAAMHDALQAQVNEDAHIA